MSQRELWFKVHGYPRYYVSSFGQVFDQKKNRLLTQSATPSGYRVRLVGDAAITTARVDRLVYQTFVGGIPDDKVVEHIDEDIANHDVDNLRLVSTSQSRSTSYRILNTVTGEFYDSITDAAYAARVTRGIMAYAVSTPHRLVNGVRYETVI